MIQTSPAKLRSSRSSRKTTIPRKGGGISVAAFVFSLIPPLGLITVILGTFDPDNEGAFWPWYPMAICGLAAVVLGIIALATKRSKKGFAKAGLILGVIATLMFWLLPKLNDPPHTSKQTRCAVNLRGIGKGLDMYAAANNDQYPPALEALIEANLAGPKLFRSDTDEIDRPCSYFYFMPQKDDPVEMFVACTFRNVDVGVRRVLLFDGVVRQWSEAEFQAELAKPCNAKFAAALQKAEGP